MNLPPTWDVLSSNAALQAEHELRAKWDAGIDSPPNYKIPLRLFDAPAGTKPRITFYHDHNVWCPFCGTLWLYLEEKRIPYRAVIVNKEPHGKEGGTSAEEAAYWRMGASGVPGFQIDGGRLYSGADLMAIEQRFPDQNPLIPAEDDPAVDRWAKMQQLSQAFGAFWGLNRATIKGRVVDSPEYKQFAGAMDRLNAGLGEHGGPFLLGDKLTILDINAARDAERGAAMLPYFKGIQIRRNPRWPHVEKWYAAMESRPSYRRIVADYFTHIAAQPLQVPFLCGPKHPDGAKMAAQLDGSDGTSWTLPLPEDDGSHIEPLSGFGQTAEQARAEAAERLIHNHRGVVGFAARGLKDAHARNPGSRDRTYAATYGKALPPAQSGAEVGSTNLGPHYGGRDELVSPPEVTADVLLRHTAHILLEGPTKEAKNAIDAAKLPAGETRAMLSYLRDRISVPRDMGGPAARQLRAHLNWVIGVVEGAPVYMAHMTPPTTTTPKQSDVM